MQPREMVFSVIIICRQLNERYGAVSVVDWVCDALQGFMPSHCTRPLAVVKDYFISHDAGLWMYGVDVATTAERVQSLAVREI